MILDKIYPVGAFYISAVNINPGTYLGGTWVLQTGGYVLKTIDSGNSGSNAGTNTGAASGNTGSTTLTAAQSGLPKHAHAVRYAGQDGNTQIQTRDGTAQMNLTPGLARGVGWWGSNGSGELRDVWADDVGPDNASQGHTHTLNNHTHTAGMPANLGVFVFLRTA